MAESQHQHSWDYPLQNMNMDTWNGFGPGGSAESQQHDDTSGWDLSLQNINMDTWNRFGPGTSVESASMNSYQPPMLLGPNPFHDPMTTGQPHQAHGHIIPAYPQEITPVASFETALNDFSWLPQSAEIDQHGRIQDSQSVNTVLSELEQIELGIKELQQRKRALQRKPLPIRSPESYGDASSRTLNNTEVPATGYGSASMAPFPLGLCYARPALGQTSYNSLIPSERTIPYKTINGSWGMRLEPVTSFGLTSFDARTHNPALSCTNFSDPSYNSVGDLAHLSNIKQPAVQPMFLYQSSPNVVFRPSLDANTLSTLPTSDFAFQPSSDVKNSQTLSAINFPSIISVLSTIPVPPGHLHESATQDSMTLERSQMFPRQLGARPPYIPGLNTVSPILLPAPSQQQTQVKKINRKRPRTPEVPTAQGVTALSELSKQKGATQDNFGALCINTFPAIIYGRGESRKRTKVRRACIFCRYEGKKRCVRTGDGPCNRCREFCEKAVYRSTSFKFTCDFTTDVVKLVKTELFVSQLASFAPEDTINPAAVIVDSPGRVHINIQLLVPLITMMDSLEPLKFRQLKVIQDVLAKTFLYSYCQSIVRWKRAFLFFAPDLRCQMDTLERGHRKACQDFFTMLDKTSFFSDRERSLDILLLLYDEVRSLKSLDTVNPSVADHLQSVLDNHLKIRCAPWLTADYTIEDLRKSGRLLQAQWLDSMPETSKLLPPQHRGCSSEIWKMVTDVIPCHTQCLKTEPKSDDAHQNSHKRAGIPRCFCGWTVACLPPGFLLIFGYTASSLSCAFHHTEYTKLHDLRRNISRIFEGAITISDSPIWPEVKVVIRHAITLSFRLWFESLMVAANSDSFNNLPEYLQREWAEVEHPKVMTLIITAGLTFYLEFMGWSKGRYLEQTGPQHGHDLRAEMETWAKENEIGRQIVESISEDVRYMMGTRTMVFAQLSARQSATT